MFSILICKKYRTFDGISCAGVWVCVCPLGVCSFDLWEGFGLAWCPDGVRWVSGCEVPLESFGIAPGGIWYGSRMVSGGPWDRRHS